MVNISQEDIKSLPNDPPSYKRVHYPYCKNPFMPKMYPLVGIFGARGMGKTVLATRWLKNLEEHEYLDPENHKPVAVRHILFSPTYESNPVFNSLEYLDEDDIHTDYSDNKLIEVMAQVKEEKEATEKFKQYIKAYKKFLKTPEHKVHLMSIHDLVLLYEYNFEPIEEVEKQITYPNGVITTIILDDLLSSSAFSQKKNNKFVSLCLNSRHYGVSIVILGQYAKAVNKSLRANITIWCLFRFKSTKILEDLYQDVSNDLTWDEFMSLYQYATAEDYCCLTVDSSVDKEYKYKINFSKLLKLTNKKDDNIINDITGDDEDD